MAKQNFNNNNKRMQVKNFEKKFNTFTEMVTELKEINPEIQNIFTYDEDEVLPANATADVVNYYLNNIPDVINRSNLQVALSISSNKMSLKTNKFFAIKWRFNYDANGFVTDIVAGVSVFMKDKVSKILSETIDYLKDENNGWSIVEPNTERPNRRRNFKPDEEPNKNSEVEKTDNETVSEE